MTLMKIEVFPDTSTPAGGHAIIRLKGVALLPPGATYRIDPIDEALNEGGQEGWPHGARKPIETRQTPDGVEMRIGPDVVDAPLLEPGTPVTISVPEGHVSAELVWPDLPMSAGLAGQSIVLTPSQMAAELAANERAKTDAFEQERLDRARKAAEAVAAERDAERIATLEKSRMMAASRELEAALAQEPALKDADILPSDTDLLRQTGSGANERLRAAGAAPEPHPEYTRQVDTALSSLARPYAERTDPHLTIADRDTSLPAIVTKRATETASTEIESTRLRPETIEGRARSVTPGWRWMPFLAGAGAAGLLAAAVVAVMVVKPGALGTSPTTSLGTAGLKRVGLADAFTVGAQSPRGELAADVDLPTALRLADYNLHGVDRPIDRAEAEFWLKKAMSLTASHSQIRWAITQLGTLAAEPVAGPPDYEKARLLWEIAAANGDPVAMCFLGTLLENGLGLAADRRQALSYFKQSKEAGGCPNSDEAIARLSR